MKSHVKRPGYASRLGDEVLRAVLPHEPHAGVGEHAEFLEWHVLDRGEHLHLLGVATRVDDLGGDSLEVGPHGLRAQAGYWLNHATPACLPVTPPSRR